MGLQPTSVETYWSIEFSYTVDDEVLFVFEEYSVGISVLCLMYLVVKGQDPSYS